MQNKLWYKRQDDLEMERNYIQSFIDLYFFDSKQFKIVEDIVPENLGDFLEVILRHYEQYHFRAANLSDLCEAMDHYFLHAYIDDFPDTCFPAYPANDRRNLALYLLEYMQLHNSIVFVEDVPYLIAHLYLDDEEVTESDKRLKDYFDQFDIVERGNKEFPKRWEAICEQRVEAIKNNKPLPIKPMGIELFMCYKK